MTEEKPRLETNNNPGERVRFDEMALSDEARRGLKALGYELATPVQAATFAAAMTGDDLMVQSKTGTGKTTAFGLPVIERIQIQPDLVDPQCLILCPTRELAIQVAEELAELGDPKGVRVLPLYGGAPLGPQLRILKAGCDIVVGTPGRILDHVRRRSLRLVHATITVLDEADEMLSMGFWEEVTAILQQLPSERQTLLFSATLPDEIRRTAQSCMRKPRVIDISRDELTVENIENFVYETDESLPRPRNLLYVLEVEKPESAIIFCNTRDDVSVVAAFLRRQGLHALAISGDFAQKERERIMRRMKAGELQYLVATDVAARGIDISDLSHVINYALPEFTEVYLHRVGRTGRAGKRGTAISLVSGRDEITFTELGRKFGIRFHKRTLPPVEEIMRLQAQRVFATLLKSAREVEISMLVPLAERLIQIEGSAEIFAYFLKGYFAALEAERARSPETSKGLGRESWGEDDRSTPAFGGGRPNRDAAASSGRIGQDVEQGRGRDRATRRTRRERSTDFEAKRTEDDRALPDQIRLFINRGTFDGYDEKRVRDLILDLANSQNTEAIGTLVLRRTHSFVEVQREFAEAVLSAVAQGVERDNKPVAVEAARTRGR